MRIAALTALVVLVAGCSTATDQHAHTIAPTASTTSAEATPTTSSADGAPGRGASFATVEAWVQAGHPAAAAQYATAKTQDGTVHPLVGDIAFTSPTGKIKCISDAEDSLPGLSCLVDLQNPPARPADTGEGEFVADWISYTGAQASVGSMHGDPGPFVRGYGNTLPYGSRIATGDYVCRLDSVGLICEDKAAESAVEINDAGVIPFGCLRKKAATQNVAELYGC